MTDSREQFDEASLLLNEGLKSCRSVVANYRALLLPDQSLAAPRMTAANDDDEIVNPPSE